MSPEQKIWPALPPCTLNILTRRLHSTRYRQESRQDFPHRRGASSPTGKQAAQSPDRTTGCGRVRAKAGCRGIETSYNTMPFTDSIAQLTYTLDMHLQLILILFRKIWLLKFRSNVRRLPPMRVNVKFIVRMQFILSTLSVVWRKWSSLHFFFFLL